MLKVTEKNRGTMVGIRFTGVCLLLTLTILVPIFSVLPGAGVQFLVKQVLGDVSRPTIITVTIVFLLLLLLLSLLWILRSRKGKELSNEQAKMAMGIQYLMIQPLGFYLLWAIGLNFEPDGQIMFAAVVSYPVSSFWFIAVGFLLDKVKSKAEDGETISSE